MALIKWIEQEATVIDLGTDHAHLPIALIDLGITNKILAIDNNLKPLAKAEKNIAEAGYSNMIDLRLNDGLKNLTFKGDETIVVAGMGGVLISNILSEAKQRFKSNQKFILQPNWTWYELRKWLAENGFKIEQEQIVSDQKKIYSQLLVFYTGEKYSLSDTEAFCGINIENVVALNKQQGNSADSELYQDYLLRLQKLAALKAKSVAHYCDILKDIELMLNYGG